MTDPGFSNPHDSAERMLQAILRSTAVGHRDADGFNLACQLRDLGLAKIEAQPFMVRYAAGVPASRRNGNDYTERDALRSLKSAFAQPKREPPVLKNPPVIAIEKTSTIVELPEPPEEPPMEIPTNEPPKEPAVLRLPTAYDILTAEIKPIQWIIPEILAPGLSILGGRPKVGKSWLAMQWALSVVTGGMAFGRKVEAGPVLFLALEDGQRRLQDRMRKQGWPVDQALQANFLTLSEFRKHIGFLHKGGAEKLQEMIRANGFRMVVADTLSRSFMGLPDMDNSQQVTMALSPLQEIALRNNCGLLFLDHHTKPKGFENNPIDDIMSSTAKSAVADGVYGLYRDKETRNHKLMMTGRDIEEKTIALKFDYPTGCWQESKPINSLTIAQREAVEYLSSVGHAGVSEIAKAVNQDRGNLYGLLSTLMTMGVVGKDNDKQYYVLGDE